ncbi:MAG: hypothetical protein EA415_11835 [Sphaerobacteraceae bacterium]|nr:MAG: hypothetical protein EA415_11835 [Sphaerobacteraceae bacterium]
MSLTVSVDQGVIRSVSTSDQSLRIGQVLIQLGFTTEEEIEQALALQSVAPDPERIGDVLVDVGFISESAIGQAMATQIASALMVMFDESRRTLRFKQHDPAPGIEYPASTGSDPLILTTAFLSEYWLERSGAGSSDRIASEIVDYPQQSPGQALFLRLKQVQASIDAAPVELRPDQPRVERSLAFLLRHLEQIEPSGDPGNEKSPSDVDDHRILELVDRTIDVWQLTDLTRGARAALLTMLNGERSYQKISAAIHAVNALPERSIVELIERGLIQSTVNTLEGRSSDSDGKDRMFVMKFLP